MTTAPLKVLTVFDSFKGTLDAESCGRATIEGLRQNIPEITESIIALSDGGEGFVDSLKECMSLDVFERDIVGPTTSRVRAKLGIASRGCAVIESAQAVGLPLVPESQRNPLETTSYGLGELLAFGYDVGCRDFVIGIGGTSTTDLGIGAMQALGLRVFIQDDDSDTPRELGPTEPFLGKMLSKVVKFEFPCPGELLLHGARVRVACDVNNPLTGPTGAAYVYAPQKGATLAQVEELERGLQHAASVIMRDIKGASGILTLPGGGAAGGMGAGFSAFMECELCRGVELLSDAIGLLRAVRSVDVVFAGEGCYDAQTNMGKAVSHIERLCRKMGRPLYILCGANKAPAETCPENVYDLVSRFGIERSMGDTYACLVELAASLDLSGVEIVPFR